MFLGNDELQHSTTKELTLKKEAVAHNNCAKLAHLTFKFGRMKS
jgi:hypothetical protein